MNLTTAVSVLTVVMSAASKGGAVDQFRVNRRTNCAGFSWRRETVSWASYATWVLHGFVIASPAEIVAQLLGVATSGALLAQVAYYRRTTPGAEVTL